MWTFPTETLPGGVRCAVRRDGGQATQAEVVAGWRREEDFRERFGRMLAAMPYDAFRWETPAMTAGSGERPFECVVLDSPRLDRPADVTAFAEPLARAAAGPVAVFGNLGGDATMVVPRPLGPHAAYAHLAVFLRSAPATQRQALWTEIGDLLTTRLGDRPLWLSTAGGAVPWLHVRLDTRPKYYGHRPYRASPG